MSYVGSIAHKRSIGQKRQANAAAVPLLTLPRSTPLWMAAAYIWFFIIRPWEKLLPWLQAAPVEKILAIILLATVLFSSRTRYRLGFQSYAVIAFLGVLLLSAITGFSFERSWEQVYKYFTLAVFYFVIIWIIRRPHELIFLVLTYLAALMAFLAKAEWEYFVYGGAQFQMGVRRLVGINVLFGHPNGVGAMIVTSLPLIYFLWQRRADITAGRPRRWETYLKTGLIAYVAIATSALILTNSRSGMIAGMFFVFLAGLGSKGLTRKIGSFTIGAAFLIGTWLMMPEDSQNRLRTLWDPEAGPASAQVSTEGRIAGLRAGLQMYRNYPVLGVGVGNFGAYRGSRVDGAYAEAHNLMGQVLGEVGTLGSITFAFLVGTTLVNCAKARRINRKGGQTAVLLADFAVACRNMTLIMLFLGLGSHNMTSYKWLWTAAFALVALWLSQNERMARVASPASLEKQVHGRGP